jgi:hypothetical protein
MRIKITSELTVELVAPEDFKRFDVRIELPLDRLDDVRTALADIAELDGTEAAWVLGDWIVKAAGRTEAQWHTGFQEMAHYAGTKGWTRSSPLRLRGHVVWSAT